MKVRYIVLLLLVLLSVVTYLDRICIAVADKDMQADLGLTEPQWGWVLGAFLLAYGLFEIPSGGLGDKIGQRKVLTRIVLWWSAFTALTPLARNFYWLVITRFLFGAGEAGAYPNASGVISRWFPTGERARAQGIVWGASRLGGALTPLIVVPLKRALGWQSCFWLFGALGVVWAAVWVLWFRDDPAKHSAVTPDELAEIGTRRTVPTQSIPETSQPANLQNAFDPNPYASPLVAQPVMHPTDEQTSNHHNIPWAQLFTSPQLWLIVAMYAFYVWGFIFFMFRVPKFLTAARGMSEDHMKWCMFTMFIMGFFGNVIGGWLSDRLSKHYGLAIGRKVIGASCLALCGVLLLTAALVPGQWTSAILIIAAFGVGDGMLPCSWAICLDVGRRYSGAVSGAMNSAGQAAGYIATVLYGYGVERFGYDRQLLFFAPGLLVAAVVFALINPNRPLVSEN